jgi:cytochrome c oxidase subunit 2
MHIDPLEKKWAYITIVISLIMVGSLTYGAVTLGLLPPSNVEIIDSKKLHLTEEFAEDNLGVQTNPDGSLTVRMVAARYSFYPQEIEVPVDTDVTFRFASFDVLHGVHVPFTNMSTMVVPGYVSEVKTRFPRTGESEFLCNEYCGFGHDYMWSRLKVVAK